MTIDSAHPSPPLASQFIGLSYESSALLPREPGRYFDAKDANLVRLFKTLGVGSVRVGANAVDDPRIAVPEEKDIDVLFEFAETTGVKIIYSFRLRDGDPAVSARLAKYIDAHYANLLEAFCVGNEPNFFLKSYTEYLAAWKPHYEAILRAVPSAKFVAPSVARSPAYALKMADDYFPEGHLSMISNHYYFFGSGRPAEKDPEATRRRLLSSEAGEIYQKDYDALGAVLASKHIPYRIDELNSCSHGGAENVSDTYTSTLWVLDCTHWWAAHHIVGMNFHTGDSVGRDGGFAGPNYATFTHAEDGVRLDIKPMAYGLLGFSQSAHGHSIPVTIQSETKVDVTAYAYLDGQTTYLTIINKTSGDGAQVANITLDSKSLSSGGTWSRMDLIQRESDIAAKEGISMGGSEISTNGNWTGKWSPLIAPVKHEIKVNPSTAALLRCVR